MGAGAWRARGASRRRASIVSPGEMHSHLTLESPKCADKQCCTWSRKGEKVERQGFREYAPHRAMSKRGKRRSQSTRAPVRALQAHHARITRIELLRRRRRPVHPARLEHIARRARRLLVELKGISVPRRLAGAVIPCLRRQRILNRVLLERPALADRRAEVVQEVGIPHQWRARLCHHGASACAPGHGILRAAEHHDGAPEVIVMHGPVELGYKRSERDVPTRAFVNCHSKECLHHARAPETNALLEVAVKTGEDVVFNGEV